MVSAKDASGLYRSDDGGGHWLRVNDEQAFTGYYASRITVDPRDPDVVWLVGQSVRRCSDGGRTCEIVRGAPGGDDYHFVWINPPIPTTSPPPATRAWWSASTAAGPIRAGTTSRRRSSITSPPTTASPTASIPASRTAARCASPAAPTTARSATRDWRPVGGDERDYDIPDPRDPDIVYSSGLGGKITRWDARTHQSANVTPFPLPNYGQRQTSVEHHFVWVTPMAITKTAADHALSRRRGRVRLHRRRRELEDDQPGSHRQGRGRAKRCDGDPAVADARACGYGGIWSLTPSPRHAGELWVGTDERPRPGHPTTTARAGPTSPRPACRHGRRSPLSTSRPGRRRGLYRRRQPAPGRPRAPRLRHPRLRQDLARASPATCPPVISSAWSARTPNGAG